MKQGILIAVFLCLISASLQASDPAERLRAAHLYGDYEAAIVLGIEALAADPLNPMLLLEQARLEKKVGRLDEARGHLEKILSLQQGPELNARFELAELLRLQGQQYEADRIYREVRAAWRELQRPTVEQIYAIGRASHRLGRHDPAMYREAVRFLDEVIRRDPTHQDAAVSLAGILLEKYNAPESLEVLQPVLQSNESHAEALLMLARVRDFEFSPQAMQLVEQALAINPDLETAHVFKAGLLIKLEDYDAARESLDTALRINPRSLDALTYQALIHFLRNNQQAFRALEDQVLALNPAYADFYNELADNLANNRLYREAAEFSRRAIELDPLSWWGHGLLGTNQLRLGDMRAGRESLQRAIAGDPFNLWIKNKLDLLDHLDGFQTVRHGAFDIVLDAEEDPLLRSYVSRVAEAAWRELVERYQHEPVMPVRIELYPNHADFSVRTVGLPGIGLLGVAFGPVVAMDSPSSEGRAEFNWASTLWHEIAHVFHLDMTRNRVPRWFTEGLAVHEERRARPGWGFDVDLGFLDAVREGRIPPLSQVNDGFVRPRYPGQIAHAYFQSSLVFEFIEAQWGFAVIRDMLLAFRDTDSPETVVPEALGMSIEELDQAFAEFLQLRYANAVRVTEKPGRWQADDADEALRDNYFVQLEMGSLLLEQGDLAGAERALLRARELLPEYAEADSAYPQLARLYLDSARPEAAERELLAMLSINGQALAERKQLAALRRQRDDLPGTAEILETVIEINPFDIEVHRELADIYGSLQRWPDAVRQQRAVLALQPADIAEAHFQLAYALKKSGQHAAARQQIVYALEVAPNYAAAQDLLIALVDSEFSEGNPNGQSQ